MHRVFRIFGVMFLLIGIGIAFNSFGGMTGFAVVEDVDLNKGFIIGAWFILTGVVLATYRKKETSSGEKKLMSKKGK